MTGSENESTPGAEQRAGGAEDRNHHHHPDSAIIPRGVEAGDGKGLLPDPIAIREALETLHHDGPWHVCAKAADGNFRGGSHNDLTAAIEGAMKANVRDNTYVSIATLRPGWDGAKAKKEHVVSVGWLWVDVDPRAGEDLESERTRILALLTVNLPKGIPIPTLVIDSGRGFWALWRLSEPVVLPDAGDPGWVDAVADFEARNYALEIAFGADACHDIARVMRLPGTVNRKPGAGLSHIFSVSDTTYAIAEFPAITKTAQAKAGKLLVPANLGVELPKLESLDELPSGVSPRTKMLIVNGADPDDPTRYPSRSEILWAVLCDMVRAGCSDSQIGATILDPEHGISAHVLEQPKHRQYAAEQIAKARDAVAEATDPLLIEMNARRAFLTHEAGTVRIAEFAYELLNPEASDPAKQRWRRVVYMQNASDFRLTHSNRAVRVGEDKEGNEIRKPLGDEWLRWRGRRTHRALTFDPGAGEVVGDKLNLWRGFAVEPEPGDWSLMRQHILEVLADGDQEVANYIERWLALAVQKPAVPAGVALVFRGGRGAGKGIFAHYVRAMFGQHGFYLPGASALGAKFNAHFRDTVLLYADEVKWNGNKNAESLLQAIITEPELMIEGKYKEATLAKNRLHLIMTSNDDWVVPAGIDERRFAVFRPSSQRQGPQHKQYFDALGAQMDAGGLAAMLYDLRAMDLSGFNPRLMPESRELSQQKLEGLTGPNRVVMEMLMEGIAPGGFYPSVKVGRDVHQRADPVVRVPALISWAIDQRMLREAPSSQKMGVALKLLGIERHKFSQNGKDERGWGLPPLAQARRVWAESLGLHGIDWPDADGWIAPPGVE
ncbi:DUF5906 domain-containing protein [Pseudorhodobacter sp.]|uniref:DUF5906 domain-containing protein n=1 Tax=Pseudorhodobacter sp. TaxID=1934400 RepID=UPI00264A2632|nr:DUF5906 domain-containing protein [Pseudorhodobacter sp.]MDN5787890.1 DUF5906 domain-containing protein [Pseudorhodobacter sp.]